MLEVGEVCFLLHAKAITGLSGTEPTHVCAQTVQLPSLHPGKVCPAVSLEPARPEVMQTRLREAHSLIRAHVRPAPSRLPSSCSFLWGGGSFVATDIPPGGLGGEGASWLPSWPLQAPLLQSLCRGWGGVGRSARESGGGLRRQREDRERGEGMEGSGRGEEVEKWRRSGRQTDREGR